MVMLSASSLADLDYPRLLEEAAAAAAAAAAAPDASGGGDGEQQPASASGEGGDEALPVSTPAAAATPGAGGGQPAAAAPAAPELYRSWYPPVQRTLLLLSKLYRGVDARIFNGLAHEAVLAATTSVQDAARQILKVGRCVCTGAMGWGQREGGCCVWLVHEAVLLPLPQCSMLSTDASGGGQPGAGMLRSCCSRLHSKAAGACAMPFEGASMCPPPLLSLSRPGASWTRSCLPSSSCWRCASRSRPSRRTLRWWSATWVSLVHAVIIHSTALEGLRVRPSRADLFDCWLTVPFPLPPPPPPPDFTHMRDYLRRTLSGQLPLFSLSSDNAFVQLMGKGGPRLQESQVDSKKVRQAAGGARVQRRGTASLLSP